MITPALYPGAASFLCGRTTWARSYWKGEASKVSPVNPSHDSLRFTSKLPRRNKVPGYEAVITLIGSILIVNDEFPYNFLVTSIPETLYFYWNACFAD